MIKTSTMRLRIDCVTSYARDVTSIAIFQDSHRRQTVPRRYVGSTYSTDSFSLYDELFLPAVWKQLRLGAIYSDGRLILAIGGCCGNWCVVWRQCTALSCFWSNPWTPTPDFCLHAIGPNSESFSWKKNSPLSASWLNHLRKYSLHVMHLFPMYVPW